MTKPTRSKLIDMKRQLTPIDVTETELKKQFTKKPADVKKCKGRMARLKGMKTQWDPFQKQIDNYIQKKTKESKNLPEKIERLEGVIQAECVHPMESLDIIEEFHPAVENTGGGFAAYTDYFIKCNVCGEVKKSKTVTHDQFGQ